MKILIVLAHPEPKSINGQLKDKAKEVLEKAGHTVVVSDLYQMGFKAVADQDDFQNREDPDFFKMQYEQRFNTMTEDIINEQKKVEEADLVLFQFPLWWGSMPAILKGWFDRVFTVPWSYSWPHLCDKGKMKGKKALVSITTGGTPDYFGDRFPFGDLTKCLFHMLRGCLYFCGFEVLPPVYHYAVEENEQNKIMEQWEEKLKNIENMKPIIFSKIEDYLIQGLPEDKKTDFEVINNFK
ncbi:nad p h oxidoreductase-related [Anaeramoeba ignava]|uniref:Nad p h oxidoreductase-related n=1 Tax=Anaeramoeba ignava TaxID=1746090 RepID=A0A9Q0LYI4_ANAIG|nr:nad p h oxidoreductase-related [Anaeramoeba ignava]